MHFNNKIHPKYSLSLDLIDVYTIKYDILVYYKTKQNSTISNYDFHLIQVKDFFKCKNIICKGIL